MRRSIVLTLVSIGVASLALIAASLLAGAGRASASDNPFQSISSLENASAGPLAGKALSAFQALPSELGPLQNVNEARALPATVDGHSSYAISTSGGEFCLFVVNLGEACTEPLSATHPMLLLVSGPDGESQKAFGLAADGVSSVTFVIDGAATTVPVNQNVFEFDATSSTTAAGLMNAVANFADGRTVAVN